MRTSLCVLSLLLFACPQPTKYVPPPSGRCDLDFEQYKFANVGNGVSTITESVGTELKNDRLVFTVKNALPDERGKVPFGGRLLINASSSMVLNYASGRTMATAHTEVMQDGGAGGYAIVAATGADTVNDTFNLHREADTELPLLITSYYVLSPGESRMRVLTAFCNQGKETIETTVGDLLTIGAGDVFSTGDCASGFGARECATDTSTWLGAQVGDSAFGYRAYSLNDSQAPARMNVERVGDAFMTSLSGFGILPGDKRVFVRDVFSGKDLAEISSAMLAIDSAGKSRVTITTQFADGTPAPDARINVRTAEVGKVVTAAVSGSDGVARFDLSPGNYIIGTGAQGYGLVQATAVSVPSNGTAEATLKFGPSHAMNFTNDGNSPATVIARCANPPCPYRVDDYRSFSAVADRPDDVQRIALVPVGISSLQLPAGQYELEISNGPLVTRTIANVDLRTTDQAMVVSSNRLLSAPQGGIEGNLVSPWELGTFVGNSTGSPALWDWTGGYGPTLRLDQLFSLMKSLPPVTLQTPRTTLAALQVDTATGQSHADAGYFRMEPADNLFSFDFDSMAVDSVAEMNDWMTFIANGHTKTLVQLTDQPVVTLTASATSVPAGTQVTFTVDVQAADWVQFDSVELHTDAPGRESVNGVANTTFVPTTDALKKTYDPALLPTDGGLVHVTETFTVTVTNSTWFVAIVRGTGASQPIDSLTGAKVFAVTNPLFVTAQ